MKKLISLLLAAMMLLSCTTAMATSFTESIEVRETDDRWTAADATSLDTAKTELWLQVDASGQIDVTVPLVLVFKTNIDGGEATSPDAYKITNNSTADLAVTGIAVTEAAGSNMTLVDYVNTPAEDEYKVQLTSGTYAFDLADGTDTKVAKEGGLFTLDKAAADGTGTDTSVTVDMATGALSFVTKRVEDDSELDSEMGVQLLTLTYTVAIKTQDAVGTTITDNGDATVNGADN